jgi:dTDP-glucose 4,6-dehydratase
MYTGIKTPKTSLDSRGKDMTKKTALITGGAGFIGSHLCDKLINEDLRVICLDNLITGNFRNIKHLVKNKAFKFIEHNVSKYIDIKERIDFVLHFASPASPEDYLKFPIQTLKVGSLGTHNSLGLAKDKKAVFILASTSEVYGDPLVHPQHESYWGNVNPIGIRGCYDESKRFAEAITMAYRRVHNVDTCIIRIFNTYGERMRINDGRVIPNFIYQALTGEPITVYGKGKQTRSFCYVSDLIEGIFRVMNVQFNQPINLGNPNEFTIMELAKIIIDLTGTKSRIIFKPLPEDDPRQRQPDIRLAKKILKWEPKVSLKEGLKKTISWFQARKVQFCP